MTTITSGSSGGERDGRCPTAMTQTWSPRSNRGTDDLADLDLRAVGEGHDVDGVVAVVLGQLDLGVARTVGHGLVDRQQAEVLGPEQHLDRAVSGRPSTSAQRDPTDRGVGVAVGDRAGHEVGVADEARHPRIAGVGCRCDAVAPAARSRPRT